MKKLELIKIKYLQWEPESYGIGRRLLDLDHVKDLMQGKLIAVA